MFVSKNPWTMYLLYYWRAVMMLSGLGATSGSEADDCSSCLHGHCYKPTIVHTGLPFNIIKAAVSLNTNTLYFIDNYYSMKKMDLENGEITTVIQKSYDSNIYNNAMFTLAVDQSTDDIYFSNVQCQIYKFSPKTNETTLIKVDGTYRLSELCYLNLRAHKGMVYVTDTARYGLYVINGTSFHKFEALKNTSITDFDVNENGDMYLRSDGYNKIFRIKANENIASEISLPASFGKYGQIALNKNGNLYVKIKSEGMYLYDEAKDNWVNIGTSYYPFGTFMFDKHDNFFTGSIVYHYHKITSDKCNVNGNRIVKLSPVSPTIPAIDSSAK